MFLAVKNDTKIWINIEDILFIESQGKYAYVHTTDNVYKSNLTLSYIESNINSEYLIRTHRSYIVNLSKISSFEYFADRSLMVKFAGIESNAFVSRSYIKTFFSKINDNILH